MKLNKSTGIFLVSSSAVFLASTFSLLTYAQQIDEKCCPTVYKTQIALSQCQASNKSWFSWLTGNSRSAQFHYLDLLELLSNSEKKTHKTAIITKHFK
ncbi:hypothetical protein CJF42_20170 [Pseudoalteromonas sp. NBT06-2]|uniref:hypothetical protein n=1 Tax=Pseudoalteromonas sp. NBT06-2 TaxID=2025950 RepID=UPI000BA6D2B1|nr:hypothetical protein [Pseudoalteromonas sp. NBT06-2]PAJ72624.1 hypothetical protein CJF42_20170 [Pseudoalteromonas sp. NBT06-2]